MLLDIHLRHTLQTAHGSMAMEVDLTISKGEVIAITGDSGAGKTTLLRQIAGLAHPFSGKIRSEKTVWLDTSERINIPPQKRNVGFVFQDYALFPHFTVLQNLEFALNKGQDPKYIYELLEAVELTNLADRKPFQLSGGQQQRAALARALVRQPEVLLLDEPMSALDISMRKRLQQYLVSLRRKFNLTILIVTHDLGEIFSMADRVVVIDHGKITQLGTPKEIFTPKSNPKEGVFLYGEILNAEPRDNHLLVTVLIQQSILDFKVPLFRQGELLPGRTFVINYDVETPDLKIL